MNTQNKAVDRQYRRHYPQTTGGSYSLRDLVEIRGLLRYTNKIKNRLSVGALRRFAYTYNPKDTCIFSEHKYCIIFGQPLQSNILFGAVIFVLKIEFNSLKLERNSLKLIYSTREVMLCQTKYFDALSTFVSPQRSNKCTVNPYKRNEIFLSVMRRNTEWSLLVFTQMRVKLPVKN